MSRKLLYTLALLIVVALLQHKAESKKVVIHLPYRVKNVKHTHTVYKIVPHHHHHDFKHSEEDDKFEYYRK